MISKVKKPASVRNRSEDAVSIPQYPMGRIFLLFAWPAAWFTLLSYGFGRLTARQTGGTPTWALLSIIVLGTGAELVAGILLLRKEGHGLDYRWMRSRIRLYWPRTWRSWTVAGMVFVVAFGLSMAMGPVNRALASVPGFVPPSWWPAASNPTVTVTGAADVFPDVNLLGNYGFVLIYLAIGLVFNVVGEELYYRGYLLPRMRGAFGKYDWVANGVLFMLKHVYQRWLFPGILIGGLGFAFAAGPLGSLPLAMAYHWLGNFLMQTVFLVKAALGA